MIQKPIFLIGFMTSGKTKHGKKIANRLNLEFIDLDSKIEEINQESISSIFENRGEGAFRKLETAALKGLNYKNTSIIALGGGTPCYLDNMDFIKKTGKSIYLKLNAATLIGRLKADKKKRPLVANLNDNEITAFVKSSLEKRETFYKKADYTINLEEKSFDELFKLIKS